MRIVGGTARGRALLGPPEKLQLRPTSDKVREAVFDVLAAGKGGSISGRAIDLFAGTGAYGIEALSRGASEAVFVERSPAACALIRENLQRLDLEKRGRVHAGDTERLISRLAASGERPFDLAFIDPPYGEGAAAPAAERLLDEGLLAPGGIIVIESSVRETVEAPPALEAFRRKRYGDTCVAFLRPAGQSSGTTSRSDQGKAAKPAAGASS